MEGADEAGAVLDAERSVGGRDGQASGGFAEDDVGWTVYRKWILRCGRSHSMGWGDLTDVQRAVLKPLLPKGARAGQTTVWPRRQ